VNRVRFAPHALPGAVYRDHPNLHLSRGTNQQGSAQGSAGLIRPNSKFRADGLMDVFRDNCQGNFRILDRDSIYGYWSKHVKTLAPSEPQNSWDLWMFIPLELIIIGFDPRPYLGK